MPFVGGKLRLKGEGAVAGGVKKKKKKKTTDAVETKREATESEKDFNDVGGEKALTIVEREEKFAVPEDRRTEAEKRFEARVAKLEEERARKAAAKSHRERVKELNEKLATLTEHHDIPRISYSYM